MITKEKYEKLKKKLKIEETKFPSYEEIEFNYKCMQDILKTPIILEEVDEEIFTISELYCLFFGTMSLAFSPIKEEVDCQDKLLFASLFTTITNSITSIIFLTKQGLDYQANVIMRQLFELCMVLLNVGIDKEKFIALKNTEIYEGNVRLWRKYFSPKSLNETLGHYEGNLMTEWRKSKYGDYSNFIHNEYLHFSVFSFSKALGADKIMRNNVWGGYVSRINPILCNLVTLLWYTSKAFMKILLDEETHLDQEKLITFEEMWNLAVGIFALLDEYYIDYMKNHPKSFEYI